MNDDDPQTKSDADSRTLSALLMVVVIASLILGLIALILPGVLGILLVVGIASLILGLIAMILPGVLGILLVVGGLAWFGVLHYALWGWWLGGYLRRREEAESEQSES